MDVLRQDGGAVRRLRRTEIAGQAAAAFTPNVDDRFGTAAIGSHVGRRIEVDVVDTDDPLPGCAMH